VAILSMQDTASDCVLARLAGYRCALQGRNKLLAEIAAQHPTDIVLAALRRRAVPSETDHPSPHATAKAGDSATSIIIDSANPLKDKLTWSQLTTAFREQRWT
jgi:hypothetical protein